MNLCPPTDWDLQFHGFLRYSILARGHPRATPSVAPGETDLGLERWVELVGLGNRAVWRAVFRGIRTEVEFVENI